MDYEAEVQRLKNHNRTLELDRANWKAAMEKYKQLATDLSVLIADERNFLGADEYGLSDKVEAMLKNEAVQELLIEKKRRESILRK